MSWHPDGGPPIFVLMARVAASFVVCLGVNFAESSSGPGWAFALGLRAFLEACGVAASPSPGSDCFGGTPDGMH